MEIKRLVKKAQRGDSEAFKELFYFYKEQLYRTAFSYTKNKEDALDVMQETAYRALRNIVNLKEPKYFKTWLFRITINCSLNILQSREKSIIIEPSYLESYPDKSEDIPLNITLNEVLTTLNHKEKSVVVLRFYLDCTLKEIANILDMPIGSVKSVLYRSLEKLRNNIERGDYYE